MRKWISFFFVLLSCLCYGEGLLDKEGRPTSEFSELLQLFQISEMNSIDVIADTCSKNWVTENKERWQFAEKYPEKRTKAINILKQIGCIKSKRASQKTYDGAIVLGASTKAVKQKLSLLVYEWKRGVRFKQVIFLTGQRDLDPAVEDLKENGKTETEMMVHLYQTMKMPKALKSLPLIVIDTPKQEIDSVFRRPNRADTVREWLKNNPTAGTYLVFSRQPFIGYEDVCIKNFLPAGIHIETIGARASNELLLAVHLDNIAKWLKQEVLHHQKSR
ncbi:MAG: hypothetical protein L0207_04100 [Chlamydiae bacterium]|nr:hypothetical protein [Chlamydiota bacterium]